MDWLEQVRTRLELFGPNSPDKAPKRFAPYSVWSKVRIATVLAYASIVLGLSLTWLLQSALPHVLLIAGVLIGWPARQYYGIAPAPPEVFKALIPELVGGLLGSRYCPSCGQSIFDNGPPSGYMSDDGRGTWWLRRYCANCGHDLKVRAVD